MNRRNHSRCKREHRLAFTLIETVLAVTLGALLMVALTGVIRATATQVKWAEAQQRQRADWLLHVEQLLLADFRSAVAVHEENQTVWITGHLPNYADTNQRPLRRVGYTCTELTQGLSALVRIDGDQREFICLSAFRLQIERIDASGSPQQLPKLPGPVPDRLRAWFWGDDPERPLAVRDLAVW